MGISLWNELIFVSILKGHYTLHDYTSADDTGAFFTVKFTDFVNSSGNSSHPVSDTLP